MNYLLFGGQGQKFETLVSTVNLVKIAEIWINLLPAQQITFIRRILLISGVTNFSMFSPLLVNIALSTAINKYTGSIAAHIIKF